MLKKSLTERFDNLMDQEDMIGKSVDFWNLQMDKFNKKLKKIDKLPPEKAYLTLQKLEKELNILLARGNVDLKNIENWSKTAEILVKDLKDAKKEK